MLGKITVNGKEQIFSTTVIMRGEEEATFKIHLPLDAQGASGVIHIELVCTTTPDGIQSAKSEPQESGAARFTFTNWNSALGVAMTTPLKFGIFDGRKVYFDLVNHAVGVINVCSVAVLLGAKEDD